MSARIIELNGAPALAVVPVAEWSMLLARLEELQEIVHARVARATESFPAEFVDRLLAGESPLRAWRHNRSLTLQALAKRCGVARQILSLIEHGKAKPSADLLAQLAAALGCEMDDLHS